MSNIIQLKNPRTEIYHEFKKGIDHLAFNWNYYPTTNINSTPSMLSHTFLGRPKPETKYSMIYPDSGFDVAYNVLEDILNYNNIVHSCYYRININRVFPQVGEEYQQTPIHVDHWNFDLQREQFPHWNILVYLSDGDGRTVLENEEHIPEEDDVIIFPGVPHCHELPKTKMRTVLVATYI